MKKGRLQNKEKKGVTLVALVITIIVLLIILGIAINIGINSVKSSKLNEFTTELQIMESQVNLLSQKGEEEYYKGISINNLDSSTKEKAVNVLKSVGIPEENYSQYSYYSASDIANELNVEGITRRLFDKCIKKRCYQYGWIQI